MHKFANCDTRFAIYAQRRIQRERESWSHSLFVPSPASSSFRHESVPWKTSKTVLGIATDLSQPSLHRASMLFFVLLLHPPSHDATLYSARLINQRNLPDATGGDNLALCHDPPLYGLFNWHASNQLGAGYRQKKGASHSRFERANARSRNAPLRNPRTWRRYLTWAVSSSRRGGHSNLRVRWDVENVTG